MRIIILVMACLASVICGFTVEHSLAADYTPPSLRAWQRSHEGHLTIEWAGTTRVQQKRQGDRLILRFAEPLDVDIKPALQNISNFVESNRTTLEGKDLSLALQPGVSTKVKVRDRRIVTVDFMLDPTLTPKTRIETSTTDGGIRLILDWPGPTRIKTHQDANKLRLEVNPPRAMDPVELTKLQQTLLPWFSELRSEERPDHMALSMALKPQIAASIRPEGAARTVIDFIRNASAHTAPERRSKGHVFVPERKPVPSKGFAKAQKAAPPLPKKRPHRLEATASTAEVDTETITGTDAGKPLPKTLVIDWQEPVAAAIFLRANFLWAVFDEPDATLLASLPAPPSAFGPGILVPADGGTALRFPLLEAVQIGVSQTAEGRWQVEPIASSSPPQPLTIERVDGSETLRVAPVSGDHIVRVIDPAVGDHLDILPIHDLGMGQPERRRFVDLELLPTTQGLAWRQLNDRLTANIDDKKLEFGSPKGLLLSTINTESSNAPAIVEAMAKKDPLSDQAKIDQAVRPAIKPDKPDKSTKPVSAKPSSYFGLANSGVERELVNEYRRIRRQAIREASPESKDHARLSLARLLVAERLANEARTILSTISDEADTHVVLQKQALKGVSALLIGHLAEATSLLLDPRLSEDEEIDVWRAALESIEDNWEPAAERWRATSDILDKYPPRLKLDLGLMALRAAIEIDDDRMMRRGLRRLTPLALSPYDEARINAMKALKAERAGDLEKARALLTALTTNPNQTIRTVADFQLATIELEANSGDPALLRGLDSASAPVRRPSVAALATLAAAAQPEAVHAVSRAVATDPDILVRSNAAYSLGQMARLPELDPTPLVEVFLGRLAAGAEPDNATGAGFSRSTVRQSAAYGLAQVLANHRLADQQLEQIAAALPDEPDRYVQGLLVEGLARVGHVGPTAQRLLIDFLTARRWNA